MRIELLKIEAIERFLEKVFSKKEEAAFSQKMENDEAFKQDIVLQKNIIDRVSIQAFNNDINQYYQLNVEGNNNFSGQRNFRSIFLKIIIPTLIICSIIYWLINKNISAPNSMESTHQFENQTKTNNFNTVSTSNTIETDLSELFQKLEKPFQQFNLNYSRDTTIICKEGTALKIKAYSFAHKDGTTVTDKISFRVQEYYKISDMLMGNLSTMTKSELLETGGMLYLEAFSNGKKLTIKRGRPILTMFPYENRKEGMLLFTGNRDENNHIEWNVADSTEFEKGGIQVKLTVLNMDSVKYRYQYEKEEGRDYNYSSPGNYNKKHDITYYGPKPLNNDVRNGIIRKINYHKFLKDKEIEGDVVANFWVGKKGLAHNIKTTKSLHPALDRQVIEAISCLGKWTPLRKTNGYMPPMYAKWEKLAANMELKVSFNLDYERFINQFEEKIITQNLTKVNALEINKYLFNIDELGWVNCDRFKTTELTPYSVKINPSEKVNIKIVLKNYPIIIEGKIINDRYLFRRVPKDGQIILVGLKYINGDPYIGMRETSISEDVEPALKFEKVSIKNLKEIIRKLDNRAFQRSN